MAEHLIGMLLGSLNMIVVSWLLRRAHPNRVDKAFRRFAVAFEERADAIYGAPSVPATPAG